MRRGGGRTGARSPQAAGLPRLARRVPGPQPQAAGPRRPLPALELPLLHHVQHFPGSRARRRAAIPVGTTRPLHCRSISSPHPARPPRLGFLRAFCFPPALSLCKAGSDGEGGCPRAHTHTHTHIHMHACMHARMRRAGYRHTASLRSRSCEDADTFYPGKRSTRRRMRNGRRERRPCWTGIRSPRTRLAAAPPARPPVGRSVLPRSLPPSAHGVMGSPRPPRQPALPAAGSAARGCGSARLGPRLGGDLAPPRPPGAPVGPAGRSARPCRPAAGG